MIIVLSADQGEQIQISSYLSILISEVKVCDEGLRIIVIFWLKLLALGMVPSELSLL